MIPYRPLTGDQAMVILLLIPVITFLVLHRSKIVPRVVLSVAAFAIGDVTLPYFTRAAVTTGPNACCSNLCQLQEAKRQWAELNHKKPTDIPILSELVTNGLLKRAPMCSMGGNYTLGAISEPPTCSSGRQEHVIEPPNK